MTTAKVGVDLSMPNIGKKLAPATLAQNVNESVKQFIDYAAALHTCPNNVRGEGIEYLEHGYTVVVSYQDRQMGGRVYKQLRIDSFGNLMAVQPYFPR